MNDPTGMLTFSLAILFVLWLCAYIGAVLVRNRAWKLREWTLTFREAFSLSAFSILAGFIGGLGGAFLVAGMGADAANFSRGVAGAMGVALWGLAHTFGLCKAVRASYSSRNLTSAGLISAHVGGLLVFILAAIGIGTYVLFAFVVEHP
jgi:hypothetical protein